MYNKVMLYNASILASAEEETLSTKDIFVKVGLYCVHLCMSFHLLLRYIGRNRESSRLNVGSIFLNILGNLCSQKFIGFWLTTLL